MKDRPILFSEPMVRAILAGTKTQTRRLFKAKNGGVWPNKSDLPGMRQILRNCPYGQPGDRLWVRETFAKIDGQTQPWIETDYRATYQHGDRLGDTLGIKKRWTPAIHMPRAASRLTLAVNAVRVERLQDIREEDARAEGVDYDPGEGGTFWVPSLGCASDSAADSFRLLWESINGPGTWALNPWVWVINFGRVAA